MNEWTFHEETNTKNFILSRPAIKRPADSLTSQVRMKKRLEITLAGWFQKGNRGGVLEIFVLSVLTMGNCKETRQKKGFAGRVLHPIAASKTAPTSAINNLKERGVILVKKISGWRMTATTGAGLAQERQQAGRIHLHTQRMHFSPGTTGGTDWDSAEGPGNSPGISFDQSILWLFWPCGRGEPHHQSCVSQHQSILRPLMWGLLLIHGSGLPHCWPRAQTGIKNHSRTSWENDFSQTPKNSLLMNSAWWSTLSESRNDI